jgi:biotin transport system ATP-binding protein
MPERSETQLPVLEVSGISRRFYGQTACALDAVSFSVPKGEFLVISGANGSGKSVLMHLIAGLDEPTSGRIEFRGNRVGLVFQNPDAQILGDTPLEDVAFGPRNLGQNKIEASETARRALADAGLAGKENHPARSLSGGEKRRLAVAGIMAMDADLVIFDEPYANLDWPGVLQVNAVLSDLRASGKTVIVLTHELEKILARADRLLVLHAGRIVWQGKPVQAVTEAPLESWGIRNPLGAYRSVEDLVWENPE